MGCGNEEDANDTLDETMFGEGGVDQPTLNKTTATYTYHLPYFSGESYVATTYSGHNAWDFNLSGTSGDGDCGEPVVAVTSGKIIGVVSTSDANCEGCTNSPGNYVKLDHDIDSNTSYYYHLRDVYVVSGQWVQQGQALGTLGDSGNASACHLHYEIRNSSGTQITQSTKFYFYKNGAYTSNTLSSGSTYTSYNHYIISNAASRNGGSSKVGTATTKVAYPADVEGEGFVMYYSGGSYGTCGIYYEAKGCKGGDFCPSYNNTNSAWLVRTGFYAWYDACGEADTCWVGFPTGDEFSVSGGAKQTFEYGYLVYSTSTGQVTAYSY
ncbi:MAG: M23 family metallopeptidase [Candidatus Kerfeldbacteria bacterium]|nr:M23 family metallopeptidase [Candidatus Kerfeldbacteria bacterium]